MKIGTDAWWRFEALYGQRGIFHAILILVEGNRISIKKGVELMSEAAEDGRELKRIPRAPWDEVRWGGSIKREGDES